MGGGSNIEGEVLAKQKKNSSAEGSLKFREVSNSFWEGTRREKPVGRKIVTYFVLSTSF